VTSESRPTVEQEEGRGGGGGSRFFSVLLVGAGLLMILGALILSARRLEYQALAQETEALAIPTVAVTHPSAAAKEEELRLPGTLQAYVESPIYARTNGYLRTWSHDIGSRVGKGEVLAELETPEVDQQLAQAQADLNTARANARLSEITAKRLQDVGRTDAVSKQEVDNATGDLEAKRAVVQSAEANVRRLQDLESFKHVHAPFSGLITRRNVDIGTLVNAGNGGTSQELFRLAQTDPIRVYVSVPETYAPAVHAGRGAHLALAEYPGQEFHGHVVRTAEAIDPGTRTLRTEVDVPNEDGRLLPGGYAQVRLDVKVPGGGLEVPVNALLFRSEGLRTVVVDSGHRTHLRPLTIGRDYGTSLEILSGLKAEEWIVVNPPDSLEEGQEVRTKEIAGQEAPGPAAGGREGGGASGAAR